MDGVPDVGAMRTVTGLLLTVACAAQPAPAETALPAPVATAAPRSSAAPTASPSVDERPELRVHFEAEHATGTIALFDSATGRSSCSDVALCQREVLPASTFKIPNALIALETGVLEDPETVLQWDGRPRAIAEWNQDHTLRTAMRVSCVPCFQWVARSIGIDRMRDWVSRFEYGNRDVSGGIDQFWLSGGLRISPLEQIDFLRRLDGGKLPVGERSLELLRDILALDVGQNHVLRGKTGLSRPPEAPTLLGWFVGWVEIAERRVYFATLVTDVGHDVDIVPLRRRLTERILRALDSLPA